MWKKTLSRAAAVDSGGSRFRARIYAVVRRIPRGKVASYGMVALLAGRMGAARAVGAAMREVGEMRARERKGLHCHRVIKSDGSLTEEVFGGKQEVLLRREGVRFLRKGRVDMGRCEWEGERRHEVIA